MKRIDRETVQRILDTADIVDVVSDFVRLKKRGSNYIGLCPFHSERTPSFSVSKSRGICKCFSCGKGGSPVGFIMEHEGFTYNEALRYLAHKYNIPIKEYEVSEEEQKANLERESMLAVNEWACGKFTNNLSQTEEGKNIGLEYFYERGLNQQIIERFRLGYAIDRNVLAENAEKAGYSEKYLLDTGLCYRRETGNQIIDRFKGRVIFPVFSVSGKVVAFGGRTLRNDKNIAKYVNSPESEIYSKSKELYGLYQAKQSIVKKGYCILVEGYMDVLSMAQSGVDNIVASSGTSLTEGQIRLIHRFTDKVTLMYDSDPAGVKAALRGVDLLLEEGLDISIVLLPDGDDPDSFAQKHSSSEVDKYIVDHSEDFIKFKAKVLLGEVKNNPIKRADAIKDIVNSIASIHDEIKRAVYCKECSRMFEMDEDILQRSISSVYYTRIEKNGKKNVSQNQSYKEEDSHSVVNRETGDYHVQAVQETTDEISEKLRKSELEVLTYIVRYGYQYLCDGVDAKGNSIPMNVIEIIDFDMKGDGIEFSEDVHQRLFSYALDELGEWYKALELEKRNSERRKKERLSEGIKQIREQAADLKDITVREEKLLESLNSQYDKEIREYAIKYLQGKLLSNPDDGVRRLATSLAEEKHQISRFYSRFGTQPTEADRLEEYISNAMNIWKYHLVEKKIEETIREIKDLSLNGGSIETVMSLMKKKKDLDMQKSEFGQILGERVFIPVRK